MNTTPSFNTIVFLLEHAQSAAIEHACAILQLPTSALPPMAQLRKHVYQCTDVQFLEFLHHLEHSCEHTVLSTPALIQLHAHLSAQKEPHPFTASQCRYLTYFLPLMQLFFCDPKVYALFLDAAARQQCNTTGFQMLLWHSAYHSAFSQLPLHLRSAALGSTQILIDALSYTSLYLLTQHYACPDDKPLAQMDTQEQLRHKLHQGLQVRAMELKAPPTAPLHPSAGWLSTSAPSSTTD